MAAFSERTRFELGDQVTDGRSVGVIVWSDFASPFTGTRFFVVDVKSGPAITRRRPRAKYPWAPLLDYEPKTCRYRCTSCDREFWAPEQKGWCRQCVRKDEGDRRQGCMMAGPGRRFASDGTGHEILPAAAPPAEDDSIPF
jgi:hypothetical protein